MFVAVFWTPQLTCDLFHCCSGVLAESLTRSRQRWISDGLFEKYWTKPVKKKGVLQEDPKNPPKESMAKVGQVTISLEPHYFEAVMYAVKDPNKPQPPPTSRPVLQYGPPNGTMPPPPAPSAKSATPVVTLAPAPVKPAPSSVASSVPPASGAAPSQSPNPPPTRPSSHTPQPPPTSVHPQDAAKPGPALAPAPHQPLVASPRPVEPVPSPNTARPMSAQPPSFPPAPASSSTLPPSMDTRSPAPLAPTPPQGPPRAAPPPPPPPAQNRPATTVPGTDPIIVTLAEKANEDPALRDLMKRVANGNAPKDELARFQAIIDQITAESKRKGASQGPSAERLLVDGKTVRYFADEVDTIMSILMRTNPKQKSADLVPPANSNPLVVELVKAALDDKKTMERVSRIAKGTPEFSDATDLKDTLERLKSKVAQQRPQSSSGASKANGAANGQPRSPAVGSASSSTTTAPQQALRSKGPPPAVKPDVAAVVFEFVGGNGDRYLFPKFSIVEQVQAPSGPQVVASFLIVRKGSSSEYGGDPKLDYYQPITVRISSSQPKHLEYFPRIVAPQEEVRRYMDDIMDNMTRAEYVLLAMRLPKPEKEPKEDGQASEKENNTKTGESNNATPEADERGSSDLFRKGLTWKKDKTMKLLAKPSPTSLSNGTSAGELDGQESYQSFIASVSRKKTEGDE